MRLEIRKLVALSVLSVLFAGCGAAFYPRVGGGPDGTPIPTDGTLRPGSPLGGGVDGRGGADGRGAAIERICRGQGTPSGWAIIAYAVGGDTCPPFRDGDNPYNVAVIERIRDRPVGSVVVVCADQAVPRGWARDRIQDPDAECPGARVAENASTVSLIRRVR